MDNYVSIQVFIDKGERSISNFVKNASDSLLRNLCSKSDFLDGALCKRTMVCIVSCSQPQYSGNLAAILCTILIKTYFH
jgi:hypothetical protein